MSQLMDYAEYLAKEIGPRPAGTEEEQQAALYITEQFQKEAGFTSNIEEFSNSVNSVNSRAILALVVVVVTILAMLFSILVVPAFILTCAAAVIYVLEEFDRPLLSRLLASGESQNVVAKYQPSFEDSDATGRRPRTRKIILVAHYDTGRVTPAIVERVETIGLPVPLICAVAMIAEAFFSFIRIFVSSAGGVGLIVLNILSIVALLVCLLPAVKALLIARAPYNEGANNNATGTAALIEVARRIARGSVSEADLVADADGDIQIHGEEAAREAGLIPEGVQIRYEAEKLAPPEEIGDYDEEERLLAAKAAIAALTGKPVERRVFGSVAENLVNNRVEPAEFEFAERSAWETGGYWHGENMFEQPIEPIGAAAAALDAGGEGAAENEAQGFENAPSWFVAAQQNARRPAGDDGSQPVEVQRSVYTEAMENAERERADRLREEYELEMARAEEERRAREQEMREALEASAAQQSSADQQAVEAPEQAEQHTEAFGSDGMAEGQGLQAPDSTIAMAAPVPTAEILAELEAERANEAPEMNLPEIASPEEKPARKRVTELPSIRSDEKPASSSGPEPVQSPSKSGLLRRLRTTVPSLSGIINPVPSAEDQAATKAAENRAAARRAAVNNVPNVVDVPSPKESSSTSSRPSVSRSTSARGTASGQASSAQAGIDIPRSRAGSLLSRRKGAEDLAETPQEWLDVDKDFDARTVGKERGSWESFRDDQYFDDDAFDDEAAGARRQAPTNWQGGAYSRMQLGYVNMRSGAENEGEPVFVEESPEIEAERSLTGEIEQIYHFRNPQFNSEVWFVAIGSDGENHNGVRAFLEAHRSELRGSMVIEVESLGVGDLAVATEEGRVRKLAASSRVKRFMRNASAACGLVPDNESLAGRDSIASVVQKAGFQAMHLFGAEDGRPALKGSADDVLENVDERVLDDNVNFVFELLKN